MKSKEFQRNNRITTFVTFEMFIFEKNINDEWRELGQS